MCEGGPDIFRVFSVEMINSESIKIVKSSKLFSIIPAAKSKQCVRDGRVLVAYVCAELLDRMPGGENRGATPQR